MHARTAPPKQGDRNLPACSCASAPHSCGTARRVAASARGGALAAKQEENKAHTNTITAARMAARWRRTSGVCEWELAGSGTCEPGPSLLVAEGRGSGHARRHCHGSLSPPDSGREGCRRRGESVCTSDEGRKGKRGSRHGRLAVRRLGISHGHSPRQTAEAMKGPLVPLVRVYPRKSLYVTHTSARRKCCLSGKGKLISSWRSQNSTESYLFASSRKSTFLGTGETSDLGFEICRPLSFFFRQFGTPRTCTLYQHTGPGDACL
jgi:hypothetical protein